MEKGHKIDDFANTKTLPLLRLFNLRTEETGNADSALRIEWK